MYTKAFEADMRNKNIVITGGAGFIGSNLAYHLAEGNSVTIIDDLSTGNFANIRQLVEDQLIRFIEGSIGNPDLPELLKNVDFIFHQAAIPPVPRSIKDPLKTNEAGVTATLKLLVAARDCKVEKFIFASSSAVYGDTPTVPKHENMVPRPLSPYALTKLCAEHYCRLFTELYGLPTICLRYFNVYGPRQDPQSEYAAVIPRFITKSLTGERLPIYGDGTQTRDFTFVKDVVNANILAAESDATGVFNIASGRRTSINELAKIIFELTGKETGIDYLPARSGDVKHSLADISRAKTAFGHRPQYTLEQGLKETVEWFKRLQMS